MCVCVCVCVWWEVFSLEGVEYIVTCNLVRNSHIFSRGCTICSCAHTVLSQSTEYYISGCTTDGLFRKLKITDSKQ